MKKIKLFRPYVSRWAIWNAVRVLRSGQLAEGPEVKKFEQEFAFRFGLKNVLALNSGSSALELAYELAGINEGDEVITTILTCTATNIPLVRRRAKIIFADIDYDLNINVKNVKDKITEKTKAIVFVHFGGNNRGLQELLEIAEEKNIVLIEDAAQAIGSDFWGRGDFVATSLQAVKTLTSGDGGFLVCKKDENYQKAKRLRWFGYDREKKQRLGDIDLFEAGYKYHMNDISAAIGRGNLRVIDKIINHRKKLMETYNSLGCKSYIWLTTFLAEKNRDELMDYLKSKGIETGLHHFRNDKYTLFGPRQKFPIMDELESRYLLLPMNHKVSFEDAKLIMREIKNFYK